MGKGDSTGTSILDEAFSLATRIGFEGLTIGQLAEQMQMSKSGIYAHFKSKEQLQLDTLIRAREHFVDRVIRPALAARTGRAPGADAVRAVGGVGRGWRWLRVRRRIGRAGRSARPAPRCPRCTARSTGWS
ncbi:TetR/AcrR family transcriptional regulator [Nocardioides sp. B-3]|nr:helix-turn-helix domain-containing protein [Nocardioides sp. B-3]UUZ61007.1 TetR/AcrR family transcriptional regulator [Nocardioides sp. B-3]